MSSRVESSKLVDFYFQPTGEPGVYKCLRGNCGGKTCKQKPNTGYTNLRKHLQSCIGDEYEKIFKEQFSATRLENYGFGNTRANQVYRLIRWIVMRNLPISEVDHDVTKDILGIPVVSSKTLRKYIMKLAQRVKDQVSRAIPGKFAIIFDGWTECRTHFVAVFATYMTESVVTEKLLGISPLADEENLGAAEHVTYLNDILKVYGQNFSNVVAIIGDNCAVNKKISRLISVPLIGCASHKFNLAVKLRSEREDNLTTLISRISQLMRKLRKLKHAGKLRSITSKAPILPPDTRWMGNYVMLKRFLELEHHLSRFPDLLMLLPSPAEKQVLVEKMSILKKFYDVHLHLQSQHLPLRRVRAVFDGICEDYPDMQMYLGPRANISTDPVFESAVCKIQSAYPNEPDLSEEEVHAASNLEVQVEEVKDETSETTSDVSYFAQCEQRATKRRKVQESRQEYINCDFITGTSNRVERLFSAARLIVTDYRKSMRPELIESLLILKINTDEWNENVVFSMLQEEVSTVIEGESEDRKEEDVIEMI